LLVEVEVEATQEVTEEVEALEVLEKVEIYLHLTQQVL
jgi:hypothetical protein